MSPEKPAAERERYINELPERLDPAMSVLGIIFLLVVLGQTLATEGTTLAVTLTWVSWGLWTIFLVETSGPRGGGPPLIPS
jgi:voltage-gated potassium channel